MKRIRTDSVLVLFFFSKMILYSLAPPDNFGNLRIIGLLKMEVSKDNMKRFFEEHTVVVIICIVISLLLCIIGCINNINDDSTVTGKGLLKVVGDNLTDTIDTYQKQVVPNENLLKNSDKIRLRASDFPYETSRIKNKIIVLSDNKFNAYEWASLKIPFSEVKTDNVYTFSGEIKTQNLYTDGLRCEFDFRGGDSWIDVASYSIKPNINNKWQKFKCQVTVKSNNHGDSLLCITSGGIYSSWSKNSFKDVEIEYRNFKLEKGTKATPYVE